eukprot:3910148-Amphidinium_carterae.1
MASLETAQRNAASPNLRGVPPSVVSPAAQIRPSPVPAIAAGPGFVPACAVPAKAPCPSMVGAPPSQGGTAA